MKSPLQDLYHVTNQLDLEEEPAFVTAEQSSFDALEGPEEAFEEVLLFDHNWILSEDESYQETVRVVWLYKGWTHIPDL